MTVALSRDQPAVDKLVHRIVAQIEAIGPLPRNVEWLHHGAVSGIDSFREVSRIVVVGRQRSRLAPRHLTGADRILR